MSKKLVTVSSEEALGRMKTLNIHPILVVINSELVGIISDRDILRNISPFKDTGLEAPRDKSNLMTGASQIMTKDPTTVHEDSSIRAAGKIIFEKGVGLLPAVDAEGKLVGVVSWKDVLRFAIKY